MAIITILISIWTCSIVLPILWSDDGWHWGWLIWVLLTGIWIIPIFTGFPVKSNVGQYTGYITAVEQNGAIFKGWNVYLKTELESSDVDIACINRDNKPLIEVLKVSQKDRQKIVAHYEGVWLYPIGVCPNSDWMIKSIELIN